MYVKAVRLMATARSRAQQLMSFCVAINMTYINNQWAVNHRPLFFLGEDK